MTDHNELTQRIAAIIEQDPYDPDDDQLYWKVHAQALASRIVATLSESDNQRLIAAWQAGFTEGMKRR